MDAVNRLYTVICDNDNHRTKFIDLFISDVYTIIKYLRWTSFLRKIMIWWNTRAMNEMKRNVIRKTDKGPLTSQLSNCDSRVRWQTAKQLQILARVLLFNWRSWELEKHLSRFCRAVINFIYVWIFFSYCESNLICFLFYLLNIMYAWWSSRKLPMRGNFFTLGVLVLILT